MQEQEQSQRPQQQRNLEYPFQRQQQSYANNSARGGRNHKIASTYKRVSIQLVKCLTMPNDNYFLNEPSNQQQKLPYNFLVQSRKLLVKCLPRCVPAGERHTAGYIQNRRCAIIEFDNRSERSKL
jgi:hypothetical protein